MRINSKEKFITLMLSTMAQMGFMVETYDFEQEMLQMMSDRRYTDLFYFFESLDDLDFADFLEKYYREGLIELNFSIRTVTIRLLNRMFYPVADEELAKYDETTKKLMQNMLRELDLSKDLRDQVGREVKARYYLSNPNGLHDMKSTSSIVTDGSAINEMENETGTIVVQDATFLIIQDMVDSKLKEIKFFYKFEDKHFVYRVIKEVMEFYRSLREKTTCDSLEHFEKIPGIDGYRYRKYLL